MHAESLTTKDIIKLTNFRTGLRKYLINSRFFCSFFDLTEIQYVLLLNIKMLEADEKSSCAELKERLNLTDADLDAAINHLLKTDLLVLPESYPKADTDYFRLSDTGNKVIEFLALLHNREFEAFKNKFAFECSNHCTSPVCWKGTD